ncbi:DUF485 domain-containing protein [Bacillus sp. CECT 9360]|uniref:DUF485 domain-containing protein n=1 Tax=Bacillus sp. CECT 9360 TaxID=2845821 RepID=UPI001E46CF2C|nr:DUF485 domain-containing protein [Bacillus sp. CECT 9360]
MNESGVKKMQKNSSIDYTKVVHSSSFKELMHKKKKFIIPMSIFFMVFYFTLPILTAYSTVLNQPAFASISWAWVFAFAQFIMTVTLCMIYTRKAREFDEIVEKVSKETRG